MPYSTDDVRIREIKELQPPSHLIREFPCTEAAATTVFHGRQAIHRAFHGQDGRLVVVIGPCSIHDRKSAIEYAKRLVDERERHKDALEIVMRVYFEKPRTTVGWKGLINDPQVDGSFRINEGLRVARGLLARIAEMGLPAATEFLDPITPQYVADLVSYGAIGARTTESQIHRELASGLSMPVGFKNGTDGSVQVAVDACLSARSSHWFPSVTKDGVVAIFQTSGNPDAHVILRGGSRTGPNYGAEFVTDAVARIRKAGLDSRLVVDCSHGNSSKDHRRQPLVAADVAAQVAAGSGAIAGVMIESHLVEGRQDWKGKEASAYGCSITDACISFEQTVPVLAELAAAVRARRALRPA